MAKIKGDLPRKKHRLLKALGIILAAIIVILACVYFFVLRYPQIKTDPEIGKWYRVSSSEMKSSEGGEYHALFKKGAENKVMVYFAGGGVSINEQTARNDTYNTRLVWPDVLANITMNMGGLASDAEGNPFKDWTMILFPYATGDFHCGMGEYNYIDKDGKEKTLYHNGYTNFRAAMDLVFEKAGIENAEAVLVTGYSAGGWGASLLADDVFSDYFPNAASKTVLVDSSIGSYKDWKGVAEQVWQAPKHIVDRIRTNNITYDSLAALYEKHGDAVNILFDCSTRDGDLAKVGRYFRDLVLDEETGEMPIEDKDGDIFQAFLKDFVTDLKANTNANVFIFDGYTWYDRPYNLTSHTIISTPYVFEHLNNTGSSIAEWVVDAMNGSPRDYGLDLVDKAY